MSAPPLYDPEELAGLIPADPRQPLPMRALLARIVDGSELDEFKANFGTTLITVTPHAHARNSDSQFRRDSGAIL